MMRGWALVVLAACAHAAPVQRLAGAAGDFDTMWSFVAREYAYLDERATDWDAVRELYRPRAEAARDRGELMGVLEAALDELYDPHNMLGTNGKDSWHPVPRDLIGDEADGGVVVVGVRPDSAAQRAGVKVGMVVSSVDGVPIGEAIAARLPRTLRREDAVARRWAVQSVLAGRHGHARRFGVGGEVIVVGTSRPTSRPTLSWQRLDDGLGYVQISTFGDEGAVAAFDEALEALRDAPGLIIDVRDNGGGDTAIAVPIMGRFVEQRKPYAQMMRRGGERWVEYVEPRGPWTYGGVVVVLVDGFSVSMAEGFAMGMRGLGRGVVVGTRTAGLGAAVARRRLPALGADVQISAEPVFDVEGRPREDMLPDVVVPPDGSILTAGRAEAMKRLGS
jgi:carboxyl-terminal processing protease